MNPSSAPTSAIVTISSGAMAKIVVYAIAAARRGALSAFQPAIASFNISRPARALTIAAYPVEKVTSRAVSVKNAMARRLFATLIAVFAVAIAGCAQKGVGKAASTTAPATGVAFGNVSRGADVFRANCAVCHTANGAAGGVGPSLEREKQRKNYEQTLAWIMQPDPPMPKLYPASLSEKDVEDVAAYVASL